MTALIPLVAMLPVIVPPARGSLFAVLLSLVAAADALLAAAVAEADDSLRFVVAVEALDAAAVAELPEAVAEFAEAVAEFALAVAEFDELVA